MKKLFQLKFVQTSLFVLFCTLICTSFIACSNDDEPENPSIYGHWDANLMDWGDGWEYPEASGKFIQFNSNGTGTASFDPDDNDFCEFTYTINGSTIKIIGTLYFYGEEEIFIADAYIVNLTKNSLELRFYLYGLDESFLIKYSK